MKQKILLHACCAPCAAGVWQQIKDDYEITLFWYNSNIFPKAEHDRRLNELLNFCDKEDIKIMVGDYDWVEEHAYWLQMVKGLDNEPERGKRCQVCYRMRLEAAAAVAAQANDHHENEFNLFGAALSISPHKDSLAINEIGNDIAKKIGVNYLSSNFKKADGFKKASKISRELKLYRQNYCGCEFSAKS